MQRLFPALLFLLAAAGSAAQSKVYLPRNLQRAYDKATRSMDGKPGPNYWQNQATYTIAASLEPKKRRISGTATIVYTNNSPDQLSMVRLKLLHDMYRKGGQRMDDVNPGDIDDGVDIEALTYNGEAVAAESMRRHDTYLDLPLDKTPLASKASATITVRWSYTLPADKRATRECVCDPSSFFVAYWYPQVAVYDDCRGWADAPYNGLQEFYNDFADYDVTLTLPRGYMLWATGEWQNPETILEPAYLDRFQKAHNDTAVSHIFTEAELKAGGVYRKAREHVFHYKAVGVPDFAFAASDHYNWDASSVVVDERTGRRTFVSAAYDSKSTDYYQVARIAADGIRLMSTWLPGYPFPYPCETVFNGNDGMEYPMMVNDASMGTGDPTGLTVHEVSHTYFPFMMGINEQDYAWMDEGWASFFDFNLADSMTGGRGNVRGYSFMAGTDVDVPPMVRSRNLVGGAYSNASYGRPQNAYLMLLDELGYDTFHRCMVEYMDRWKGKHPMPQDFFNTWNAVSGQNLDWFWKPWFFEWGYPDLSIQTIIRDEAANSDVIVVEKKGNIPVPVHLEISYTDGTKQTIHQRPGIWRSGETLSRVPAAAGKTISNVTLGSRSIPDTDQKNNTWKKA